MSDNTISSVVAEGYAPVPGAPRPSMLPKFAACRCYDSSEEVSEAAQRGTAIDELMRLMLLIGADYPEDAAYGFDLNAMDLAAAEWGVRTIREIAGDSPIVAKEEDLHVDLHTEVAVDFEPGRKGTLDALIPQQETVIDFKTGQIRNYKEQMAAYCLAMMNRSQNDITMEPTDRYTAHLVFVDQREVVTHVFTREEAEACVRAALDRPKLPTACDYCSWCRHFGTCPVTQASVAVVEDMAVGMPKATPSALSSGELPDKLAALVDDEESAHCFLAAFATVEKWVDLLKSKLKKKIVANGGKSSHFTITKEGQSQLIMPLKLGEYIRPWGTDAVLGMFKPIKMSEFLPVWQKYNGDKPVPEKLILTKPTPSKFCLKKTTNNN